MNRDKFQDFLLRSAVVAMACDGSIAKEEITVLKNILESKIYFLGFDYEKTLAQNLNYIKSNGKDAVEQYLSDLTQIQLEQKQKMILIEVLLDLIEADDHLAENEIVFLRLVQSKISIDDNLLIVNFPLSIKYLIDLKYNDCHLDWEKVNNIKIP